MNTIQAQFLASLRTLIQDDPKQILSAIKGEWEAQTGKKLYPAQSDNFVLNELAARESNVCTQMIYAMMQNYVRTATGVFLEALGEFWGVKRIIDITHDENDQEIITKETDERLRERIILAPEAITSCGTVGAYRYFVLTSDISITDVDFSTPDDGSGRVHATVLTKDGMASDDLINKVFHVLSDEKNAVLCVNYSVSAPVQVNYHIDAEIIIYDNFIELAVQEQVQSALEAYAESAQETLGKDIVLSQILDVIHNIEGVYSASLKGFPESGIIKVLSGDEYPVGEMVKIAQWPVCNSVTTTVIGAEYG